MDRDGSRRSTKCVDVRAFSAPLGGDPRRLRRPRTAGTQTPGGQSREGGSLRIHPIAPNEGGAERGDGQPRCGVHLIGGGPHSVHDKAHPRDEGDVGVITA